MSRQVKTNYDRLRDLPSALTVVSADRPKPLSCTTHEAGTGSRIFVPLGRM